MSKKSGDLLHMFILGSIATSVLAGICFGWWSGSIWWGGIMVPVTLFSLLAIHSLVWYWAGVPAFTRKRNDGE